MRRLPDVVDHDQHPPLADDLAEASDGGVGRLEARPFVGENFDQVHDVALDVPRLLAEGDPEDAVVEGVLDPLLVTDRAGKRGLAVAAGALERGGDRNRLLPGPVEQRSNEGFELARAAYEHLWQVLDHERRPRGLARRLEGADEAAPLIGVVGVDEVRAAHPAGQRIEVDALCPDDRDHALALLAGVVPLTPDVLGAERGRSHDQDQEFDVVDRVRDLLPPVLAALHVGEVLPERKTVLVLKPAPQLGSDLLPVAPGVGDENARRGRCWCHGELGQSIRRSLLPS
jgi:hypothetical protein